MAECLSTVPRVSCLCYFTTPVCSGVKLFGYASHSGRRLTCSAPVGTTWFLRHADHHTPTPYVIVFASLHHTLCLHHTMHHTPADEILAIPMTFHHSQVLFTIHHSHVLFANSHTHVLFAMQHFQLTSSPYAAPVFTNITHHM